MAPLPIFFIDHNPLFLGLALRVIAHHYRNDLEVVGTAASCAAALAQLPRVAPQVILIGLGTIGFTDLALIPELREALPDVRIIVLGLLETSDYQVAAHSYGADGFVPKIRLSTDLLPAIRGTLAERSSEPWPDETLPASAPGWKGRSS